MYSQYFEPRKSRLADPEMITEAMRRAHRMRAEAMIELWRQLFANVGRPDVSRPDVGRPDEGRRVEPSDVHTHLPPTG